MRLPKSLLDAVKERAKVRGIPYTRLIRQLMEREVSRAAKARRKHHVQPVIALARQRSNVLWAMLTHDKPYDPAHRPA